MLVKMLRTKRGRNLCNDLQVSTFKEGEVYDLSDDLAQSFLASEHCVDMESKSNRIKLENKVVKIEEDKAIELEKNKYREYTNKDIDKLVKEQNMAELKNVAEYVGISTKDYPRIPKYVKAIKKALKVLKNPQGEKKSLWPL